MLEPAAACARLSLRMRLDDAGAAGPLNFAIPINRCVSSEGWSAARLGPDEWRLLGPAAELEAMTRTVSESLGERFFSLVDVSHRDEGFWIDGDFAREILNGGCPLDLSNAAFPAGAATRTILGKAEIVLFRPGAEIRYRVECGRSFATYVEALLAEMAREFLFCAGEGED